METPGELSQSDSQTAVQIFIVKKTSTYNYLCVCDLLYAESEYLAEDEACDTHNIEQTDKGFRCAIDVPSVLYKQVTPKNTHKCL